MIARRWIVVLAVVACGPTPSPAPPPGSTPAPGFGPTPAADATAPLRAPQTMTLPEQLRDLLGRARSWPVTAAALREHLEPRARSTTVAGPQLDHPAWAESVNGANDIFVDLGGDVVGIHLHDDPRGWGAYAELAVARGTLADVEAVTGPLARVPTAPDDFRGRVTVAAYPEVDGHRIRVFVEHVEGAVKSVLVHFERAE